MNQRGISMTARFLVSSFVILSWVTATPGVAGEVAKQPNAYALNIPNAAAAMGPAQHQQGASTEVAPVRPWKAGSETATLPWSAPVGHHQPNAVDVSAADQQRAIDQEDARVDRIVRGICRGC
jgi:hypothetical protein